MSDDLIDRQYAIATAITGRTREIDGERWIRTSEVRESLKRCPSAQPERKTGQWIKIHWKAYRCSECNRASEYSTDYCPNCGAKMEGDTDATD